MGIMYKGLTFDGVNSLDYGIYITGEGVYNAPTRDVEMITIAGRNGEYALDKGRFNNISITYKAGAFASTQTEFAEKISDFRNAILSRVGYKRLEDDYHTDEYRMAVYMDGLEVDPVHYSEAGEFELTFNCKPQRFLKSGEEPQTIGEWGETETVSGSIATFEAESNTGIKSLVVDIEPVQSGSGDPSPTNVRTIYGWDSVRVWTRGKNIFQNTATSTTSNGITFTVNADGTVSATGTATGTAVLNMEVPTFPYNAIEENVILTGCPQGGDYTSTYSMCATNSGGSVLVTDTGNGATMTPSKLKNFGKLQIIIRQGTTIDQTFKPMIRPSTDTDSTFEAYKEGQYISKSFEQTVYGGTLDLISGVLTVDKVMYACNGQESHWARSSSYQGGYYMSMANAEIDFGARPKANTPFMCSHAKTVTRVSEYAYGTCFCDGSINIRIMAESSTLAEWKSYLQTQYNNGTPVQICYTLNAPQTYQLTSEQIQTLLGTNNIWADSGEVSVEYGADPNIVLNPTPFESQPLLEFVGLGDININDDVITVHDSAMGKVLLANKTARGDNSDTQTESKFNSGNYSLLENGDLIRVEDGSTMYARMNHPQGSVLFDSFSASVTGGTIGATVVVTDESTGTYNVVLEPFNYTKGTYLVHTVEVSVSFSITIDGEVTSWDGVITYRYEYNPSFIPRVYYGLSISPDLPSGFSNAITLPSYLATIYGYSTRTGGGVQYIDLDIGEAYIMTDGVPVSINNIVSIPARLPELKSGDNHITHDDTITSLKITPRWWKI